MINAVEQVVDLLLDEVKTPANFYVVFNFVPFGEDKEVTAEQLSRGVLEGVEGISDQSSIAIYWLGVARDAMLTMAADQFMEMNNISRIGYADPYDLMANNMANLKRLFNNNKTGSVIQRVFDYVFQASRSSGWKEYADLNYYVQWSGFHQKLGYQVEDEGVEFSTPEELAAWVKEGSVRAVDKWHPGETTFKEVLNSLDEDRWLFIINEGLLRLGTVYHSEGEWVIHDNKINVPRYSALSILKADVPEDILAVWRGDDESAKKRLRWGGWDTSLEGNDYIDYLVNKYQLDRLYNVKYINRKGFEGRRTQYFNKRDKERLGV